MKTFYVSARPDGLFLRRFKVQAANVKEAAERARERCPVGPLMVCRGPMPGVEYREARTFGPKIDLPKI